MKRALTILFLGLITGKLLAQCGVNTPEFIVNLTADPNATWMSPDTLRADTCCGATAPDKCVAFIVTLHPLAEGIIFDVCDGALPPGALFYQVNCGPPTPVGEPLCLGGPGPHYITFCKPGNNENKYCITSIAEPAAGPDISVNDGCFGQLYVSGYDVTTLQWNSIFPGTIGQYNSYLDCTAGCDTVNVTGQASAPDSVLFEVCGYLMGDCDTAYYCDTITAYFYSTLQAIIQPDQPTVCFGATGTYIYATGAGGYPPYSFQWSTGSTADSIFINVGTYYLTISDNTGCPPGFDTVIVTSFSLPIEAQAGNDTVACINSLPLVLNGNVIAASGGRWEGGGGIFLPDSLTLNASYTPSAAEISLGFTDLTLITTGNGSCPPDTDTVHVTWHEFNSTPFFGIEDVTCNGFSDGFAYLQSVTGMSITNPVWNTVPLQTGDSATGLQAGTYTVLLTDSLGCDSLFSVSIIEPALLDHTLDLADDASCNGYSDGSIAVTANGGTTPYSYLWSNAVSGNANTGIPAGTYTVTVTDFNGCADTASYTITEPVPVTITLSPADVLCAGGNTGSVTSNVTGAIGGPFYAWSNGASTANITNVVAGQYTVTVSDGNGCWDTATAIVNEPMILTLQLTSVDVTCNGYGNGTISTTVTGGVTNYTYTWSNAAGNIGSINGLVPGTYTVTVTDNNGCTISDNQNITEPLPLSITTTVTDVTCNGYADGSVVSTAAGGVLPYTYTWSNGSASPSISSLDTGTYTVQLQDSNGCTVSDIAQVTEPAVLDVTLTALDVGCYGENSGSISSVASGGTLPYVFTWSNAASTAGISILTAGIYTLTVTDGNGCTDAASQLVTEPDSLTLGLTYADVTCFGAGDGFISTNVQGGVSAYTYAWSTSATTTSVTGLGPASYSVTVTDQNNCEAEADVLIDEPSPLWINGAATHVDCFGNTNGTIQSAVSGGNIPYTYNWSTGSIATGITNLSAGIYSLSVTDVNGCAQDTVITVTQPVLLQLTLAPHDISCFDGNDGSIQSAALGGVAPYVYTWSTGAGSDSISTLTAGSYSLIVTDLNGCTETSSVILSQPLDITVQMSPGLTICLNSSALIQATATGGNGGYVYNWSNGLPDQNSHSVSPVITTTYSVSITDILGCPPAIGTVTVTVKPVSLGGLLLTLDPPEICEGFSSTLEAIYQGTTAGYTFQWNQGLGNQLGAFVVNPLTTTIYTVTVTDDCGFSDSASLTLVVHPTPVLEIPPIMQEGCSPFTTTLSVDAGTVPISSYSWKLGNGQVSVLPTPTTTYQVPGEYNVTVSLTSDKGCKSTGDTGGKVIVRKRPEASFIVSPERTDTDHPVVQTTNTSSGAISYSWQVSDGGEYDGFEITHTFGEYGIYRITLTAVNEYGCTDTTSRPAYVDPVLVFEAPDAFTPNSQVASGGFYDPTAMNNDVFYLITAYVSRFRLLVYNRWGEVVFETFDPKQGWDGYYKGVLAPLGMYAWRADIVYVTGKEITQAGNVTLLR